MPNFFICLTPSTLNEGSHLRAFRSLICTVADGRRNKSTIVKCVILFACGLSTDPVAIGGQSIESSSTPRISLSAAVNVGGTVTITSDQRVLFTVAGAGVCHGCDQVGTTTISYTAPSSIKAQNVMMGCPVTPNDSIFNTRVDSLPIHPMNSLWVNSSSPVAFSFQPSWGISRADSSTPRRFLRNYYGEFVERWVPWPQWNDFKRENGNYLGSTGFPVPDHHVLTVDTDGCMFYESYNDKVNGAKVACQDATFWCNVSSAVVYSWDNYRIPAPGGTDAAGLPLAPLVAHLSEIKAGTINHAMRFTSALGYVQGDANLGSPMLWPASRSNGCPPSVCPSAPVIGSRMRLKASFDVSGFSEVAQVFLRAMQKYGLVLSDIGTSNAITVTSDVTTDPGVMSALAEIHNAAVTVLGDMEFVDESSLQEEVGSYRVCPRGTACVSGLNNYETPMDQVTITATSALGSITKLPVAIQPITIGTKVETNIVVMAGKYSWKIPAWVNGSQKNDQTVSWTLTSGAGSLTANGVYTPPANTDGGASAVIHGAYAFDSNASIDLYARIVPAGTIRIDTGSLIDTTDTEGNAWLGNLQPEGYSVLYNDNWPGWTTSSPLKTQYESGVYTYGNDLSYPNIVVPNGDYQVSWLLGLSSQCGTTPCGSYVKNPDDVYIYGPIHLESQGQFGFFLFDWLYPVGYKSATPTPIVTIPATVTDNLLYAALRTVSYDSAPFLVPSGAKTAILSGLTISSDSSEPHWTIDTLRQTTISPGQTLLPFRLVDWYTGRRDPKWSIVGNGASITSTKDEFGSIVGTVSLASEMLANGQPIIISATDGTYSATATIYATSGTVGRKTQ